MATIGELEQCGQLIKLDPGLPPGVQEMRLIHVSERMRMWIETSLPGLGSTWNIEISPLEQLVVAIEDFTSGGELEIGPNLKALRPAESGVWELKTADLRVFGWFHARDCFIAVCADLAERIKASNLYHGYIGEVVRFREALALNEPKFLEGDNPHAVVSNYHFP